MNGFRVLKSGVLSLMQDGGRWGQHALGLTTGGAMDGEAFFWANRLVGNHSDTTAMEVAQGGLQLECEGTTTLAVTGAAMPLRINGQTKALWRSYQVHAGDRVELGHAVRGLRAYLAVAGGFEAEPFLGSTSTVLREGIGEPVKEGQWLPCGKPAESNWALPMDHVPRYEPAVSLRVVQGYQAAEFSNKARGHFYENSFKVSPRSDRMGYRLEGHVVAAPTGDRLSEGIAYGAVQVPPDGQPIILLNDRQTIGGYPKLGAVLSIDCWKLAQCLPGETVRFKPITLTAAQQLVGEAAGVRASVRLKRCE